MKRQFKSIVPGAVMVFAGALGAHAWMIIDLGTLGGPGITTGPGSQAFDICSGGIVVGSSVVSDLGPATRAFRWHDGGLAPLDPLPGDEHSVAFGICAGTVIGQSYMIGDLSGRAVSWSVLSASPTSIGNFEPRAINADGVVVGRRIVLPGGAESRAVIYDSAVLSDIPTLGGSSNEANAINTQGDVVGSSSTASGSIHAFLRPHSGGATIDLGTLGGPSSHATDVNTLRQIAGFSQTPDGNTRAFLTSILPGNLVAPLMDLGALTPNGQSYAYALNDAGVVVGTSDSHAVMWNAGVITDLNDLIPPESGWTLRLATSINDDGDIVGIGRHHGRGRAFILRNVPPPCRADLDADGDTDVLDFAVIAANFGTDDHAPFHDGDLDGDGDVDVLDFAEYLVDFGCEPGVPSPERPLRRRESTGPAS